jgi:Protein of unknown function (DUF4232)
MRVLTGAAAAAMLVLALTGCGSRATEPSATPSVTVAPTATASTTAPAATAVSSATASASAAPTSAGTTAAGDPDRPRNQCPDSGIGVSVVVAEGGGGAGSEEYDVLLTNTSGSSCALRGTPGVSVVGDGNGTQLGLPAVRHQGGAKTLVLQDGETVAAPLRIVNIGTDGGPLDGCTVQKGDGYRVYPPHSTKAFLVKDPSAVACVKGPSFMTVGPVQRLTD